jgi:tRNA (cytosine49-C5)-methyltransferase
MKKSSVDKLAQKRQLWLGRTAQILGISQQEAASVLATERQQSIRVNSLLAKATNPALQPWLGDRYSWLPEGFTAKHSIKELRDSAPVQQGQLFIQNAASWLPVLVLDPQPGEEVLDVCAAPGGKTSHIAARTNNQAHIWANDNSRARLAKLQANMQRLGAHVEHYSLYDATRLSHKIDQQFDKILLDAPCSGEGLMHIQNDKDLTTWSVAHTKRLQQLQKRILTQAWELLKPGGTLVYSTCTMAPEENEAIIDYLLRTREDAAIAPIDLSLSNRLPTVESWNNKTFSPAVRQCLRLAPSPSIEAFFVCKLVRLPSS